MSRLFTGSAPSRPVRDAAPVPRGPSSTLRPCPRAGACGADAVVTNDTLSARTASGRRPRRRRYAATPIPCPDDRRRESLTYRSTSRTRPRRCSAGSPAGRSRDRVVGLPDRTPQRIAEQLGYFRRRRRRRSSVRRPTTRNASRQRYQKKPSTSWRGEATQNARAVARRPWRTRERRVALHDRSRPNAGAAGRPGRGPGRRRPARARGGERGCRASRRTSSITAAIAIDRGGLRPYEARLVPQPEQQQGPGDRSQREAASRLANVSSQSVGIRGGRRRRPRRSLHARFPRPV